MLQAFTTLAVHAAAHTKKRILEVGCGSGMHSTYLAKSMLKRGSCLVCTDISEEMIKLLKAKFENPATEYLTPPGNLLYVNASELPTEMGAKWSLEG